MHFDIIQETTLGILIDVQDRFLSEIPSFGPDGAAAKATTQLIQGTTELAVPWVITEQVPEKLGTTASHLRDLLSKDVPRFRKMTFSLFDDKRTKTFLADANKDTLIMCGLEAHVCVLTSAVDAIQRGYNVVIAEPTISSRSDADRREAIATMRQLGVLVVPTETLLFRLCRDAKAPAFRAISKLVR